MTATPLEPPAADVQPDIPPLQGCLYCHAEGTIQQTKGRKVFGLGSDLPLLTCSACGSVAQLDANWDGRTWRIRYKKTNSASRFFYVMANLGKAGWLEAEQALQLSLNGFVQRQRVSQTQHGDLTWMSPSYLYPAPPFMNPDELVYLSIVGANIQQASSNSPASPTHDTVLDTGTLHITDHKIHLLGQRRDWSHPFEEIHEIAYDEHGWMIHAGPSKFYYYGASHPDMMDGQLLTAIVRALMRRQG